MKKTLLILAAGMGTRYGGLKQIDTLGPNGEYLIDYGVYDAMMSGFDKVVFVIKRDFAKEFKRHFPASKFKGKIKIEYAYQDLNDLPMGFKLPQSRTKPWGTGHAILAARNFIKEPFAVINADDFYGRQAFEKMSQYLEQLDKESQGQYCMIGYHLEETLSDNGWVARGLCKSDEKGNLISIYEHTKIGKVEGKIISRDKAGNDKELEPKRLVSMTMFGFTPDFFDHLQTSFVTFLDEYLQVENIEFFAPNVVNEVIQTGQAQVKVLPTTQKWFGMTYNQDKEKTAAQIKKLIQEKVYPYRLW